jgi:hypothetical protein
MGVAGDEEKMWLRVTAIPPGNKKVMSSDKLIQKDIKMYVPFLESKDLTIMRFIALLSNFYLNC